MAVLDLRYLCLRKALTGPRTEVALREAAVAPQPPNAGPHLFPASPFFLPLGHEFRFGIFEAKREGARIVMSRVGLAQRGNGMLAARMTKPKEAGPPLGRYSHDRCLVEIAEMTERSGLDDKAVHLGIGMKQTTYSKKASGGRRFTIEELGRIADFFSRLTGRPLQGWPFVSNDACLQAERQERHR